MNKKKIFIVAEIGSVHDGSFGNACNLIKIAKECGADAIKFQTHLPEYETLKNAPNPSHFNSENRFDYFQRTGFSFQQYKFLNRIAKKNKIIFMSSPFSIEAVDMLKKINMRIYKIPSGEVNNIPLLEKIKKTRKEVFLSTGMSNWEEINDAYKILKNNKLTILQCTSTYPCRLQDVGINILNDLKKKFDCSIGFSDHTEGKEAAILAANNGATVIEKHLTFSKKMYGSDARFAMEIPEFKEYCRSLRKVETLIYSKVNKNSMATKLKLTRNIFSKSIVSKIDIPKNKSIEITDLAFKKPGHGVPTKFYKKFLRKKAKKLIKKNMMIKFRDIK